MRSADSLVALPLEDMIRLFATQHLKLVHVEIIDAGRELSLSVIKDRHERIFTVDGELSAGELIRHCSDVFAAKGAS